MSETEKVNALILAELENFCVKDTYTKGKNAGLRKALCIIEDVKSEHEKGCEWCSEPTERVYMKVRENATYCKHCGRKLSEDNP